MRSTLSFSAAELRTESRREALPQADASSRFVSRFAGKHVHFIGVGGSGMNGLARILMDSGATVTGSEPRPTTQTFDLIKRGARISRTQGGELLSRDVDLVVRSAAIADDNPEFLAARAFGIRTIKYAQMLGQVMDERFGIAVAGTHGKSTTTAMTAYALLQCGADPSFVVGGTAVQLGGTGSHSGRGACFVAEACEYDRSFHNLHPKAAIVTNIEEDHLDCYRDLDDIIEAFRKFIALLPADGLVVTNGSDANVAKMLQGVGCRVETVSLEPGATWYLRDLGVQSGCHLGDIHYHGQLVGRFALSIPGRHNLMNAGMALAMCQACGADVATAIAAISDFKGVDRRMTEMGRCNGAIVVDDYGHHPTEIRATLGALREKYQPARLLCVFQPHQASRTRTLLDEFGESFELADETIIPDIYYARDSEADRQSVSAQDLVDRIASHGKSVRHIGAFPQIVEHLKRELREGDLVVTMGAGNVWEIARDLAL